MTVLSSRMMAKVQLDDMLISDSISMDDGSKTSFGIARCKFCLKGCIGKFQSDERTCGQFDLVDTDEIIWSVS